MPDGVAVDASLTGDGNLHVAVIDRGTWKDHRSGEQGRGRGLAMAEALVSHAVVTRGEEGTTATVTHRLTRPANFVTDTSPTRAPRQGPINPSSPQGSANPAISWSSATPNTAGTLDRQIAVESRSIAP